jgi:sec-independent protein translocase protein TatC
MRKVLRALWNVLTSPFRLILWLIRKILAIPKGIGRISDRIDHFFSEEPEDAPLPDAFAKAVAQPEGVFEHLDALRMHLLRSVLYVGVMTVIAFIFADRLIDLLAQPIGGKGNLTAIDPTEQVGVFMRVSLLAGFAAALPLVAFEVYLFIAPGLSPKSRKFGLVALPLVTLFFIAGIVFANQVMIPPALRILTNFMDIPTQLRPSTFINFVTGVLFWIGAAFQFPFLIYVLASIGLVRAKSLARQWRLAVVVMAVMAAAITPTVDPVNMAIVMGPMTVLYFISIGLAYIAQRGRAQPRAA